jgi:hypothetical protein
LQSGEKDPPARLGGQVRIFQGQVGSDAGTLAYVIDHADGAAFGEFIDKLNGDGEWQQLVIRPRILFEAAYSESFRMSSSARPLRRSVRPTGDILAGASTRAEMTKPDNS